MVKIYNWELKQKLKVFVLKQIMQMYNIFIIIFESTILKDTSIVKTTDYFLMQ